MLNSSKKSFFIGQVRSFFAACPEVNDTHLEIPQVCNFVVQMLLVTLRDPGNGIGAKFFTREVLEGKEKQIGWVQMTMVKFPVVRQISNLAANVPSSPDTPMHAGKAKIVEVMASPNSFCETFFACQTEFVEGEGAACPSEDAVEWSASGAELAQITEGMPKCLVAFAELLHNVYAGDFDEEMTALAGTKCPKDALMDDEALGGVSPTFQCKLRAALRLVATAANQFTACSSEQESLVSVRSLTRVASHPDDAEVAAAQKERSQMWEKAREQRKKFVVLQQMKQPTAAKLTAAVAKSPPSKLGCMNRLFVWSADMVAESGSCPWREDASPKSRDTDAVLDWMSQVSGEGDFALCCDGRLRSMRRYIEDKLEAGGMSPQELFIFYASDEIAVGNKIFMGARMQEVAYVKLPCKRTRMTVQPRSDEFLPRGADSTHCPTFANVKLPSVAALPRLSTVDKATVFGQTGAEDLTASAACPANWDLGGVPLFWRESKTSELWKAVLDLFNIRTIVDFTPGSGALAVAALSRGLKYTGFVQELKHLAWLQNILDTAALRYIAKKGEVLYMEDVAELVTQHYQDLLENSEDAPDVEGLFDDEDEL